MKNSSLLDTLMNDAGLSKDQAISTLLIVTDFAKERFPILRGNINSFLNDELESKDHSDSQNN
jgi:hypothetical protein